MQILSRVDLKKYNTLGLQSEAELYTELHSLKDLHALIQDSQLQQVKWHILGGGSNLVLPQKIAGLVIKVAHMGRELLREDADAWYVKAQAGENWNEFVQWTLAQNYFGLENLSLIPGTVGAAPIQNIGAYGVEVKDFLHEVTCVELRSGDLKTFNNKDCRFSYRDSFFKQEGAGKYLIWDVTFRLPKVVKLHLAYGDISQELTRQNLQENPCDIAKAVIGIRSRKLPNPQLIGNAGSFFKNPVVTREFRDELQTKFPQLVSFPAGEGHYKLAAGWLIEQAGWKGKSLGPVGMYEKQALVLVNHGGATSEDVWNLANQVCVDVRIRFGVQIEPEPIRW